MQKAVIKPLPHRDFYIEFIYSVDGIYCWGTRAEMLEFVSEKELSLADKWGSSSGLGQSRWNSKIEIVTRDEKGYFKVLRQDIERWTDALDDDGEHTEESDAILIPFLLDTDPDNFLLPKETGAEYWEKFVVAEV